MSSSLPNFQDKQRLLYGGRQGVTVPAAQLLQTAETFFAAGSLNDAVDFFAAAQDQGGLQRVSAQAAQEGDLFLFDRAMLALRQTPDSEAYRSLAQRAFELGKFSFARRAAEKAGDNDMLEKFDTTETA